MNCFFYPLLCIFEINLVSLQCYQLPIAYCTHKDAGKWWCIVMISYLFVITPRTI